MTNKAPHPCAAPGCPNVVRGKKYCEKHQKGSIESEQRRLKKPDPFYKKAAWLRLRAVYLREHPVCERCSAALSSIVHHIKEMKDGGAKLDPNNLESVCATCHGKIHGYRKRKKKKWVSRD